MRHASLILVCAVAGLAPLAHAQRPVRTDPTATWKFLAERYDANLDGAVDSGEYGRGEDAFRRLDRNSDGQITATDFATRPARGRTERSPGQAITSMFGDSARAADGDKDGATSRAEWHTWLAAREVKGLEGLDLHDIPLARLARTRTQLDRNHDGSVSIDELTTLFDRLDLDHDGTLRGAELGAPPVPRVGDVAPDFDLPRLLKGEKPTGHDDDAETVRLSSFIGKKPVALIFGSYT